MLRTLAAGTVRQEDGWGFKAGQREVRREAWSGGKQNQTVSCSTCSVTGGLLRGSQSATPPGLAVTFWVLHALFSF